MYLIVGSKCLSWYLDNGCSRHMTGERCMFQCLTPYHGGIITFRGNEKTRITGVGKIGIHPYPSIDIVLFVEGLKHNLLSICQLCDNGYVISFNKDECIIHNKDGSPFFSARWNGNLYKIKRGELLDQKVLCLLFVKENHYLWLKKLGHASQRIISKLQKTTL